MEFTTHLGLHSQATRLQGVRFLQKHPAAMGLAPSPGKSPSHEDLHRSLPQVALLLNATFPYACRGRGIRRWADPRSLAATKGIPVGFFSSAY